MFYSHEILTNRKHGVATIWLVATLGSKSSLKKVSRKAILDVDVPKACDTIADPESPMALRLQSSLLYGVSRVFSQQCGYILLDTQSLHDKMKGISLVLRDLQIDSDMAQTSNIQLNLPSDPAFDFEWDLGMDLSVFDLSSGVTNQSSTFSSYSLASSLSSLLPEDEVEPLLSLPYEDTPEYNFQHFSLGSDNVSNSVLQSAHVGSDLREPGIDENPPFDIDENGMIVDRPYNQAPPRDVDRAAAIWTLDDDSAIEERVANEHVALADVQGQVHTDADDDYLVMDNDGDATVDVSQSLTTAADTINEQIDRSPILIEQSAEGEDIRETARAPHKRTYSAKALKLDQITELSNKQLSDWQNNYLEAMTQAKMDKSNKQSMAQAKRNAAFWILDQGIGGAAVNFGDEREPHPLAELCGQSLIDALTGSLFVRAGTKRSHNLVDDDEQEEAEGARRLRSGSDKNRIQSSTEMVPLDADDGMLFQADDDIESQVGRQLASSLKDQPSSMPWTKYDSSRQGSAQGGDPMGISSSIRGIGFDHGFSTGISGRRTRMVSASPLIGKGRTKARIASLDPQAGNMSLDLDVGEFTDPFIGITGRLEDEFEIYGPAGMVSTQQAAQSQWLNATLETEAHNFFNFLREKLTSIPPEDEAEAETIVTFADLLPPGTNSNIVAAQGILHVLALATKGSIRVHQEEAFGDISLSIVGHADEEVEKGNDSIDLTDP